MAILCKNPHATTTANAVFKEIRMPVDKTGNHLFRTPNQRSIVFPVRICDSLYSLSASVLGLRSGVIISSIS